MGHEHEGETFFPIISAVKGKYGTSIAAHVARGFAFYPEMPRIGFGGMGFMHRSIIGDFRTNAASDLLIESDIISVIRTGESEI